MRLRIPSLLALSLGLFVLPGCPAERGNDSTFGSLDTDGDGDLDEDDVAPGEAAMAVTFDFLDEEGEADTTDEALTTSTIELQQTTVAWNLSAVFREGDDALTISLRFEHEGDLETGTHPVSSGSAQPGDGSWYAYASEAGGSIVISSVGDDVGSGHFEGEAAFDVIGEFEQPTGEQVLVTGFAFRDAPLLLADL